jgi:hypothetical protein
MSEMNAEAARVAMLFKFDCAPAHSSVMNAEHRSTRFFAPYHL